MNSIVKLSIAISGLYLWDSGRPQVYHILILVFMIICLMKDTRILVTKDYLLALLFPAYILIMQVLTFFVYGIENFQSVLYYIFNFSFFVCFVNYYSDRGKKIAEMSDYLILAALISLMSVYLGVDVDKGYSRPTGGFNNPNQLGYFGLIMLNLSTLYLVRFDQKNRALILFLISIMLIITSLSKAALVAALPAILLFTYLGKSYWKLAFYGVGIPALIVSVFYLYAYVSDVGYENIRLFARLANIGADSDDNFGGRGYLFLLNPDLRVIFGVGEGVYNLEHGKEPHTSIGNIITNWGLIGGLLFLGVMTNMFRGFFQGGYKIVVLAMLLSMFLYSLTHNGLRFTPFWLLLAIYYSSINGPKK